MAERRILCYNCFRERDTQEGLCPYCGFDLEENVKKFPVALRAGMVLNDRYIVGRVLGQGGFGITYLAWDTKLEAKVAVKEFMPNEIATRIGTTVSVAMESKTEEFTYGAERFQEEAHTLAKFMGQPNIAGVTDYFDENDTSYFVMDYIEGISFKTYIANHGGKVSVDETLNVMIPILRALTAVHAEGFIHRDVTPDNIYITKDGQVKLLDFGSARYSIGDKSKSLDVVLKVGYAPKEQYIRRGRQGPFTDVYSCAACFYAALTGYLPPESLERLDHDELIPVSQAGVELPEWLDKAILKGLAVQPEDRFQSAAEFLDAIESQQVVEVPVSGGVAPALEKKKLKPALIAAIAVAVVVVVGIGVAIGGGGSKEAVGADGEEIQLVEAEVPSITIQGTEYSTDLTELDLSYQKLTNADIQDLHYMVNLSKLVISNNPDITDLSPLSELPKLTFLNVMNTGATDLSPLASLTALESLHISNAEISDLTPLAGMSHLTDLYLTDGNLPNSKISDISPLSGLTSLENLRIPSVSEIHDLTPLSGLAGLKTLSVNGISYSGVGKITSLEPLANLTNLEVINLNVDSEAGVDLTPLSGLTHLRELTLGGAVHMDSLAVFSNMTELEELVLHATNAGYCFASDLSALSHMTKLQRLSISVDGLTSLSGLETLLKLLEIELYSHDSSCTTLQPLEGLENLQSVTISLPGTKSLDISALGNLPNLQAVQVGPSRAISDTSSIDHVPNVSFFS